MHPTRIFKTPEDLGKAWAAFKEDVKAQGEQWKRVQYVGKDGLKKEDPAKVPLTLEGFKRFCRNNYGEVQHYFENKEGSTRSSVVSAVRFGRKSERTKSSGGCSRSTTPPSRSG